MPIDIGRADPVRCSGRVTVPGLWDRQRGYLLKEIERGDPRLLPAFTPDWTDEDRAAANEQPRAVFRLRLSRMDEDGWTEVGRQLSDFPEAASIPWLRDGSVLRVRVYSDDSLEPV